MKNVKKVLVALLVFAMVVCSMSSCSIFDYTIEGSWKELDNYIGLYQFNGDGTFSINGVGYVVEGVYEYEQGEAYVNDLGRKAVDGEISLEYKTITYTDKKSGKEVTEDFYYTYITTETHVEEQEVQKNPFSDEVTIEEVEIVEETEHKVTLTGPVKGTYTIVQQNKNPESLTIVFEGDVEIINEDGKKETIDMDRTSWRFERSYDVI